MFKPLEWKIEKEEREKAIVHIASGALQIHITYSSYRHVKDKKYYTIVNGPFGMVKKLGVTDSLDKAKALAEADYQNVLTEIYNMIESLKVGDSNA